MNIDLSSLGQFGRLALSAAVVIAVCAPGAGSAQTAFTHDANGNRIVQALAVAGPPTVLVQPKTQAAGLAGPARFSVIAGGPGPFTYQWFKDTSAISGATDDTLVFASAQEADFTPGPGGTPSYSVRVSNAFGNVTSDSVALFKDSLGQGLPDWWRLLYFGASGPVDPLADADGDGISNLQEYLDGTAASGSGAAAAHLGRLTLIGPDGLVGANPARATYPEGAVVTVEATSVGELQFGGWTGSYRSLTNPFTFSFGHGASFVGNISLTALFGAMPAEAIASSPAFTNSNNSQASVNGFAVATNGQTIAYGAFDRVNGSERPFVARLLPGGALDAAFAPAPNGAVTGAVIQKDGKIVIAGDFTTVGGQLRPGVARFNADGGLDNTFSPADQGANNTQVDTLLAQRDGKVLLGGAIWAGTGFQSLVRLNPDGTQDATFTTAVNGVPSTLTQQPDGKILLGGAFSQVNGTAAPKLVRLNTNGTLDTSFNLSVPNGVASAPVATLVQPDGRVLVGGAILINLNGSNVTLPVARLNADGTLDAAFNQRVSTIAPNLSFSALALQEDGRIVGVGSFTLANPSLVNAIRLNPDGSPDPTCFAISRPNAGVNAVATQTDGSILLGGVFTNVPPAAGPSNNHVYQLTSRQMTWHEAEAEAVALGGHLVAINSQAENDYIINTLLPAAGLSSYPVWIGFTDEGVEGLYAWSNGEPVTYTNWYPGEPQGGTGENYAAFNWAVAYNGTGPGRWVDVPEPGTTGYGGTTQGPYYGIIEIDPAAAANTGVNWVAGRDLLANEEPNGSARELTNPNSAVPAWSYGSRAALASTALTLFTPEQHLNDSNGLEGWQDNQNGVVKVNVRTSPVLFGRISPGEIEMHSRIDLAYVVMRWTAPQAGAYAVTAFWQDADAGGGDGASGHLVVNGSVVHNQIFNNGGGTFTTQVLNLGAGATVDFVLGARGGYDYDSTRFNAMIRQVTSETALTWVGGRDLAANELPDGVPNELVNPNPTVPEWSYGRRNTLVSSNLSLYSGAANHFNSLSGQPVQGWNGPESFVAVNTGTAPANFTGIPVNPGEMLSHPGGSAGPPYAVVRWTAPAAGSYDVLAYWQDSDPNGGNGFSAHVVVNGGQVYGEEVNNAGGMSTVRTLNLQQGDRVDFVMGARGDYTYDSTKFNATIVASGTPPPAPTHSRPDAATDAPSVVTTRAALAGNVTIDWAAAGSVNTDVANPFTVAASSGGNYTVSKATGGAFNRRDQNNGWSGNFNPGAPLLTHLYSDGPVSVAATAANGTFFGAGMQIQPNQEGPFTATIQAFDVNGTSLGSFTVNGASTAAADNSAIFIGVRSDTQNIHSISVDTDTAGFGGDFAINQVSINTAAAPPPDIELAQPRSAYARLVTTNHIRPGALSASPPGPIYAANAAVTLTLSADAPGVPITYTTLESSADGVTFEPVGFGNSESNGTYSFPISALPAGTTFYRALVLNANREQARSYALGALTTPPRVTSPLTAAAAAGGTPFTYPGTATGLLTGFTATGLPSWATGSYDANTGVLTVSGTPTTGGISSVTLLPSNAAGSTPATLTLTVLNSFSNWRTANFTPEELQNPAISGPLGDATGAGITNLLRYALGIPARQTGRNGLPTASLTQVGASRYLTLTYRPDPTAAGVNFAVEVSGNVASWSAGATFTTEISRTTNPDGSETVVTRDNTAINSANRRFIRLRVSQ